MSNWTTCDAVMQWKQQRVKWREVSPVSQRSDDKPSRVSQILVAVLEMRVGLSDNAVALILHNKNKTLVSYQLSGNHLFLPSITKK